MCRKSRAWHASVICSRSAASRECCSCRRRCLRSEQIFLSWARVSAGAVWSRCRVAGRLSRSRRRASETCWCLAGVDCGGKASSAASCMAVTRGCHMCSVCIWAVDVFSHCSRGASRASLSLRACVKVSRRGPPQFRAFMTASRSYLGRSVGGRAFHVCDASKVRNRGAWSVISGTGAI
jgi:hypothetical protein